MMTSTLAECMLVGWAACPEEAEGDESLSRAYERRELSLTAKVKKNNARSCHHCSFLCPQAGGCYSKGKSKMCSVAKHWG